MKPSCPVMLLGSIVACGSEVPGNDRPCGDSTIAVLNDERGAHEETGLLVFELLPSLAEVSYLDLESDAVLFDRVHPRRLAPGLIKCPAWHRDIRISS